MLRQFPGVQYEDMFNVKDKQRQKKPQQTQSRLRADSEQTQSRLRADPEQTQSRPRADSEQTQSRLRADPEQTPLRLYWENVPRGEQRAEVHRLVADVEEDVMLRMGLVMMLLLWRLHGALTLCSVSSDA
uniref:Uncharacterized protein n=1 Tax=Knipowitschia caucasica TaxID=637954 RepID=A0AAV2LCN4_KNICA